MNVTFMDETGEIRAVAWNAAVDELFDKLQEGKVYYVSKARVNIAKKKFNSSGGDFELQLDRNTEIEEVTLYCNKYQLRSDLFLPLN
jgi:replication factor A1